MPLRGEHPHRDTYRDLQRIDGGTSLLVDCRHEILGDRCVQKTVPISVNGSPMFQEPRLLQQFEHRRIPPVREAQFDPERDNHITFVMPKYEGGSVAQRLVDDYRFSLHQALDLIRQALDALEYAHTERGYLHRDIKTDNLLLNGEFTECYQSDWELAAVREPDGTAPAILATYHYMAPECVRTGRHRAESDVYGMAMCLFEMINGRFRWEQINRQKVEQRVSRGLRAVPDHMLASAAFAPHVPDSLRSVIRKGFHKDPGERFSSAREFIQALNQIKLIDWRHTDGEGLDGQWVGTWPTSQRLDRRSTFVVSSRVLGGGSSVGRRRLVAQRRLPGAAMLRRFGVDDRTVDPQDVDAVRQFFKDIAERVAQR